MNLKIIVVIYKKSLSCSSTLMSLIKQGKDEEISGELIIYDNSPLTMYEPGIIEKLEHMFSITYNHTPKNLTLREIYNFEIETIELDDYILFLDDDTNLPVNYLSDALKFINTKPHIYLFTPLIYTRDKLYSPHKSYSFISKPLKEIVCGICSTKNYSAINSGMIVKGEYFIKSGFRYPSFVDFYGTDKVFFDYYSSLHNEFYIMDLHVEHDVSNHPQNSSNEEYVKVLNKVNMFWIRYLARQKKSVFLYRVFMLLYALKISVEKRDFIFLNQALTLGCTNEKRS